MRKIIIFALLILISMQFVFAKDISIYNAPTQVSNYQLGNAQLSSQSISFKNNDNETFTLHLGINGTASSLTSINPTNLNYNGAVGYVNTADIIFNVPQTTAPGLYTGNIIDIDASRILFTFYVNVIANPQQPTQGGECKLISFPTSYRRNLKAGETATKQIEVYVSKYCNSSLSIHIVPSQEMDKPISYSDVTGEVQPGNKFILDLLFDSDGVQNGEYSQTLTIQGMDNRENLYENTITLSVRISGTITPVTNNTFSSMPICTLDGNMQINNTYSFVCTNIDPNLQVIPLIDREFVTYFEGLRGEDTSDRTTYVLKPIKTGTTTFYANFIYNGKSIGTPYSKAITISSGTAPTPGTSLRLLFNPAITSLMDGSELRILVADNKTGNLIAEEKYVLYVNGAKLNGTSINVKIGTLYEIKAHSNFGYDDITEKFTINPTQIVMTVSPSTRVFVGEYINVTTNVNDTKLFFDDVPVQNYFQISKDGVGVLKAIKEGYITSTLNITGEERISLSDYPETADFKKGVEQTIILNKNASWVVYYRANDAAQAEKRFENVGNTITFTPDKAGTWIVTADGNTLTTYIIENKFKWSWWYLLIPGVIIIIVLIFVVRRGGGGSSVSYLPKSMGSVGGGAVTPLP
jgi:hypothetical protein